MLILLIASAHFPSPVLISLPSSSEPLSLPSSLTVLLNHIGFFLAQRISFPSSVIASFGPLASGFCMVVFTTVLLPPHTHTQTHTNSHAHAHPRLFSACCRGDKWLLCCLATGWQSLEGKRSIWEPCDEGQGLGDNRQRWRRPKNWIMTISSIHASGWLGVWGIIDGENNMILSHKKSQV